MISALWNAVVYQPLYNVLVFLVFILPGNSVGGAIVLLTFLVKLALYPASAKAIRAQRAMRELEPEIRAIKEKYGKDRQEVAMKTMELYKERKVTPFSGCLPLLIQIPVILALYWIFWKGLVLDPSLMYGFIPSPSNLDLHFLMFDLSAKSALLAFLAGMSQYIQADISLGKQEFPKRDPAKPSFQEDFTRSMQLQMRYVFPVMISIFAYSLPSAVALYWTTSNILGIAQEYLLKRPSRKAA